MADEPQGKTIELYKVVEHATRLVGEIQKQADINQDRLSYASRRSDRRLANPKRLAKIWSEGQLQEAEAAFDRARDGEGQDQAATKKRKRRRGQLSDDPIQQCREQLFGIWNGLRSDQGFRNATKRVKSSIGQAGKEAKRLEKQGKDLDLMLNKTIAAVRDMKHAMSVGIRQVPHIPALDSGPEASIANRVSAIQSVSVSAMKRAQPEAAPTAAPTPGSMPVGGGSRDSGEASQ
ncbi:MAG: hypothetical protein AAF213_05020 [Pseudomonadota bacterium]